MWLIRKSPIAPTMLSIMRMVVGFMFLSVCTMKMFGFPSRGGAIVGFDPFTQIGLAAILLYLAFVGAGPWSLDALIADAGARRDVEAAPAAGVPA